MFCLNLFNYSFDSRFEGWVPKVTEPTRDNWTNRKKLPKLCCKPQHILESHYFMPLSALMCRRRFFLFISKTAFYRFCLRNSWFLGFCVGVHPSQLRGYHDLRAMAAICRPRITGFDTDYTILRISAMNLMLHSISNPEIDYKDSVSKQSQISDCFTMRLANRPFKERSTQRASTIIWKR